MLMSRVSRMTSDVAPQYALTTISDPAGKTEYALNSTPLGSGSSEMRTSSGRIAGDDRAAGARRHACDFKRRTLETRSILGRSRGRIEQVDLGTANEIRDEEIRRHPVHFGGAGILLDVPFFHHRDMRGHRQRFELIVRDVDRRRLGVAMQPFQFQAHIHTQARVEI